MRKIWVRAGLACIVCATVPLGAAMPVSGADYARTLSFEKTVAALAAMARNGSSAADVRAAAAPLGFQTKADEAQAIDWPALSAPKVSLVPIDLVLSQLALQAGANYHVALRQAQARPEVLMVESGVASLAMVAEAAQQAGFGELFEKTPDGYVAHVAIAVWNGASLFLQPGETLLLDREAGAFVLAAGTLAARDAALRGVGEANARLADFNPFVVVALSGTAMVEGSRFADLGYGLFPPLTGVTLVEGGFFRDGAPSVVRDSRFDNVQTLALLDASDAMIAGNVFTGAKGPSVLVSGGKDLVAERNVVLAGPGVHGIKVTAGARNVAVTDNIVVGAGLNGVFADAGAAGLDVSGNIIAEAKRSGVSVASADCVRVSGNLLLKNAQSGLAVRDSAGLSVAANRFYDNGNAGISVTHQPDYGRIEIASNELDGNRVGVKGSTTAELRFVANDFSGQAPRLFDGELVQFSDRFFDLSGEAVIDGLKLGGGARLTPSGALRPTSCSFEGDH
jgi:poly(beta-D-mannuronate) C5 epimerase